MRCANTAQNVQSQKKRCAVPKKPSGPDIAVRPASLCKTPRNGRDFARDCGKKSTAIAAARRS
jgi:hypothetical protein